MEYPESCVKFSFLNMLNFQQMEEGKTETFTALIS